MRRAGITRREFLAAGAAGGAAGGAALMLGTGSRCRAARRPNVLLICTDQQGLDTLSAYGCEGYHTPNLDRLAARGTSFMESYSTNPVCSPARSSIFTGRMACETGVVTNGRPIRRDIPNLGQWLSKEGYTAVYCGKWHVPGSYPTSIPGFTVYPGGLGGQGTLGDQAVSSVCAGFLHNYAGKGYTGRAPFLLVASFLQPHDICNWIRRNAGAPDRLPFAGIADDLPPLPPNFDYDAREPKSARIGRGSTKDWSERQWRYYLWSYCRMVEEVDHEIGRVLSALEDSGRVEDTLVVFTSDHGEGRGRHKTVTKNFLYDESAKVPLILSLPGEIPEGGRDATHLVSGVDLVPTICDYAGLRSPDRMAGASLRPLMEGSDARWREFVVAEVMRDKGRMVRSRDYKLVAYRGDPVVQLFDMKADPGETRNLAADGGHAPVVRDHLRMLSEWEGRLDRAPEALGPFEV